MNSTPIHIIYVGTAKIGGLALEALFFDDRFKVELVITQPDKPAGRKMELQASPIKHIANKLGIEVYQPESIDSDESLSKIKHISPNFLVLMAYGQILNQPVLDVATPVNIHGSLLPKYRGASPVQSAILGGEKESGISLMQMVKAMDAGPVYSSHAIALDKNETAITLRDKLAELTAKVLPDALFKIRSGELIENEQDATSATYCEKIKKSDGEIHWDESAEQIVRKIRGYTPWPGTFTFLKGKRLKLLEADLNKATGEPGVVFTLDDKVLVGTSNCSIELKKLQIEGKAPIFVNDFIKGNSEFINSKLG